MTNVTIRDQLQSAANLLNAGSLPEAERILRQILSNFPDTPDALHLLGVIAWRTGNLQPAADLIGRAVALDPNSVDYQFNLGTLLMSLRRWPEAETHLRTSLQLQRNQRAAWNNLGGVLLSVGRHAEAEECYSRAIALDPGFAGSHANRAKALEILDRLDEAEASARKAVDLLPGAGELATLAGILVTRGKLAEAIDAFERALTLSPELNSVRFNLASALLLQGRASESIVTYRDAVARQPDVASGHSAMLLALHYSPISPDALYEEHRAWAARHAEPLTMNIAPHSNDRSSNRRLRIGYVSPDFRDHAVARFIGPALALDPGSFEIFCYADELRRDDVTRRLRSLVPNWRDISALSDEELAAQVRADQIDILVDLAGHTAHNRLLAFARKPAPVQATYLGYPNTTGMTAMDWRITDGAADPPGMTESLHTERLMRLAGGAWCYQPPEDAPLPTDRRGAVGVTFGSFNALAKVSDGAIELWSRILSAVPESQLLIKATAFADASTCDRYRDAFARQGIAPGTLDLIVSTSSAREHLALYGRVDIALDTTPYNGTTTTCEAIWMGVPVITLLGPSHVSRVGTSLLANAGLSELIAVSPEQYVAIAVDLARDASRRNALRESLRGGLRPLPLNETMRRDDLQRAFRAMWQDWINSGRT